MFIENSLRKLDYGWSKKWWEIENKGSGIFLEYRTIYDTKFNFDFNGWTDIVIVKSIKTAIICPSARHNNIYVPVNRMTATGKGIR